jgi:hypothetical protein
LQRERERERERDAGVSIIVIYARAYINITENISINSPPPIVVSIRSNSKSGFFIPKNKGNERSSVRISAAGQAMLYYFFNNIAPTFDNELKTRFFLFNQWRNIKITMQTITFKNRKPMEQNEKNQ